MKKILQLLSISFLTVFHFTVYAQSFSILPEQTNLSDSLGSEITFHIDITNTSQQDLTLSIVRTLNDLPVSWTSSICLDICLSHTADSMTTTPNFGSSPFTPAETRELKLIVQTQTNYGTGNIQLKIADFRNQSDFQIVDLEASALLQTAVSEENILPQSLQLEQNYPNPFNPSTKIQYAIPDYEFVSLKIYDILGEEIATLVNEQKSPGEHEVEFDSQKYGLTSGVYIYRLTSGNFHQTKKMILEK